MQLFDESRVRFCSTRPFRCDVAENATPRPGPGNGGVPVSFLDAQVTPDQTDLILEHSRSGSISLRFIFQAGADVVMVDRDRSPAKRDDSMTSG